MAKIELAFSFRPMGKDQKVGGDMLMLHVDVKQGLVLKTTRFNYSEATRSFERLNMYTRCTLRLKTLQDVFIHLQLYHNRRGLLCRGSLGTSVPIAS